MARHSNVEPDWSSFGPNLTRIMQVRGITHEDVARILDVSPRTVYYWGSGKVFPHVSKFDELKRLLKVSFFELVRPLKRA